MRSFFNFRNFMLSLRTVKTEKGKSEDDLKVTRLVMTNKEHREIKRKQETVFVLFQVDIFLAKIFALGSRVTPQIINKQTLTERFSIK